MFEYHRWNIEMAQFGRAGPPGLNQKTNRGTLRPATLGPVIFGPSTSRQVTCGKSNYIWHMRTNTRLNTSLSTRFFKS